MPPWPHRIDEATVIDLSHEALVRQWDQFTGAKGWLQEEQADAEVWGKLCARTKTFIDNPRRLLDADETAEFASFWKRRQPSGAWLQRYRAPEAVAVAPGRAGIPGGDRTDAVERLLAASSRRRRLRAIAIGITAFVVALTVIGVSALTVFWQGERRQREAAETARAVAEVERARAERVAQEATAAAQQLQRLITDLQMTAAAAPVGSSFQRDIAQVQQSLEAQAGKLSSVGTRFAVVAGSDPTELGARAELAKASQPAFAGAQGVKVFRRQGTFRTVILFQDQTAAASALPSIQSRMKRPDAYVVDLDRWCPGRRDEGNDVVTCP
jgi:hypothetical protein